MRFPLLAAALALVASTATGQAIKVGTAAPAISFSAPDASVLTADPSKAQATVLIFVSNQCPVSNAYNERMRDLYTAYEGKPAKFYFIDANATESQDDINSLEKRANFPFRIVRDVDNVVADKLGAQFTPEVFVFDKSGILQYHGAIDDSRNAANVNQKSARDAIDALLAGTAVPVASTKAFGCSIKRKRTT
jgi:hypothetical protein